MTARILTLEIEFGHGINREAELVEAATCAKIVSKSGNWYKLEEHSLGNGIQAAAQYLRRNPEVNDEIEKLYQASLL